MEATTIRRSMRGGAVRTMMLVVLIVLGALNEIHGAPYTKPYQGTLRLCSRSLSDALKLMCHNRGYNEPFSYSGEEDRRILDGPGLVEECCYHPCSFEQLDKYCKASSEEKQGDSRDVIEESFRIVKLPYSSVRREPSSEETPQSTGVDYADSTLER